MRKTTAHQMFSILKPWKTNALRSLRGPFTQAELATIVHVRETNIRNWESGKFAPSMPNLRAMLKHYQTWTNDLNGAPLDWLQHAGAPAKRRTPWHKSGSTISPRGNSTGSDRQTSGSPARPRA